MRHIDKTAKQKEEQSGQEVCVCKAARRQSEKKQYDGPEECARKGKTHCIIRPSNYFETSSFAFYIIKPASKSGNLHWSVFTKQRDKNSVRIYSFTLIARDNDKLGVKYSHFIFAEQCVIKPLKATILRSVPVIMRKV
jgi:hypothetical protein